MDYKEKLIEFRKKLAGNVAGEVLLLFFDGISISQKLVVNSFIG